MAGGKRGQITEHSPRCSGAFPGSIGYPACIGCQFLKACNCRESIGTAMGCIRFFAPIGFKEKSPLVELTLRANRGLPRHPGNGVPQNYSDSYFVRADDTGSALTLNPEPRTLERRTPNPELRTISGPEPQAFAGLKIHLHSGFSSSIYLPSATVSGLPAQKLRRRGLRGGTQTAG
jgi:hypothetical protein